MTKDIKDFISQYKSFVKQWYRFRNQINITHIDEDEFWSELLRRLVEQKLLDKYDPNHFSGATFETWLKKVLNNLYIDMAKGVAKKSWVPIVSTDNDENFKILEERFVVDQDEDNLPDIDVDYIKLMIEKIPKVRDRILVKLKTYIDGFTELSEEEYMFLESTSKIVDAKRFINDNIYNDKAGMRDKDIASLLDMKLGSVNTTYQRIVSKYIIEPYSIYRAKSVKI